jgi:cytoskeletal protein CcmA (bactofilin family)
MEKPSTIIGAGTHIESGLRAKDDVQILGRVDGPVVGDASVTLSAGAEVGGDVWGAEVTIGCALKHNVHATRSVRLLSSAEVLGDIVAPRIVVDDGAVLEGKVKITRAVPPHMTEKKDERRKDNSPMRQIAAPSPPPKGERKIPELPALGRRVATRRKA